MNATRMFSILILLNFVTSGCCSVLAMSGYMASNPAVRNFLIRSGLSNIVTRKAERLYETSNFRHVFDQGTGVRKAQMDTHDILEVDPNRRRRGQSAKSSFFKFQKRSGSPMLDNFARDEDRAYSERLFGVLTEMDKNSCISRLLCEIGADPKSFGIMGYKINHYLKSVPPVTWNSATFSYSEAFLAGLQSGKDSCRHQYTACSSNLQRVMKLLWIFMNPINLKLSPIL